MGERTVTSAFALSWTPDNDSPESGTLIHKKPALRNSVIRSRAKALEIL
jgi:hypothetical protein